jgi:dinuclear metal center YbgI/SA1388 family protein
MSRPLNPRPSASPPPTPRGRGAELSKIVACCDRLLETASVTDWDGAVNGLQVANRGRVTRIAAAVDATLSTIQLSAKAGADLLVVHHGLFWSPSHPWTGRKYDLIRTLMDSDMAVYSSHLPLDLHPSLGNNAGLFRALGCRGPRTFFVEKGRPIGLRGELSLDREALVRRLAGILGVEPRVIPGGPARCRRIGIVTGGAGAELRKAAAEGVDTFITGEGPHWTYALAEDLGLNVIYGGHYATETFGVKALAAHLSRRFRVPWGFIDYPTGL